MCCQRLQRHWLRRPLAIAVLLAGLIGCEETKAKAPPPPPTVTVARAVRQDVALTIEAVGNVDGYVNAEIRARVRGILQAQRYKDGAAVKQGQLLFTIDRAEYQAAARRRQGGLGARADRGCAQQGACWSDASDLSAARVVSEQELEDAEAAAPRRRGPGAGRAGAAPAGGAQSLVHARSARRSPGSPGWRMVRVGNLVGQDGPTLLTTVSAGRSDAGEFPAQRGRLRQGRRSS